MKILFFFFSVFLALEKTHTKNPFSRRYFQADLKHVYIVSDRQAVTWSAVDESYRIDLFLMLDILFSERGLDWSGVTSQ